MNNITIKTVLKKAKALCWLNDHTLVVYRSATFFSYDVRNDCFHKISKFHIPKKKYFFSLFSFGRRLLRLYPQSPYFCKDKEELLFTFSGAVYSLNLNTGLIKNELILSHNASRVLSFCSNKSGNIFFGEYPTKKDEKPVRIWKRTRDGSWEVVYSFPLSSIRHIHLLQFHDDNLYCFTGDEDNETKILCFHDGNFVSSPLVIASGSQKYRSCVATFFDNNLIYLTDNPYFTNILYSINLEYYDANSIGEVEGSVMYGLNDHSKLYFSTCVERNLAKNAKGKNIALRIDGLHGGIKSNKAIVYSFDLLTQKMDRIFEMKKDCLPIKLFGVGTFIFTCNSSKLFLAATSSALKNSETVFIFKKEEE